MPFETGIRWLDRAVNSAELPDLADAESARTIYNSIRRSNLTMEGFRRLPIPYRRVGKIRTYEVPHVVAAAKQRVLDAPLRWPAQRAPGKSARNTGSTAPAVDASEEQRRAKLTALSPKHA
jgi:hypothetical protein